MAKRIPPVMLTVTIGVLVLATLFLVLYLIKKLKKHKITPITPIKPPIIPGILKPGDNGAVSCQEYCTGKYGDYPVYKKAVAAIMKKTGDRVDVNLKPGAAHDPDGPPGNMDLYDLDCYCSNDS